MTFLVRPTSLGGAADPVLRHLVPIYIQAAEEDRPSLLGTAVYVHILQFHFLLTAAHVADKQQADLLYIPGANACMLLPKVFRISDARNNRRRDDRIDLAWIRLEDAYVTQ